MKQVIGTVWVLVVAAGVVWSQSSSVSPTMVSISSLLSYYGFTGGTFNAGSDIVTKIPRAERRTFGAFEGSTAIDTPEEFITAANCVATARRLGSGQFLLAKGR